MRRCSALGERTGMPVEGTVGDPLSFGRRKDRGGCLWVSSLLGSGVEGETILEYIPALLFILTGSRVISYRRDPNFVKTEVGLLIDRIFSSFNLRGIYV